MDLPHLKTDESCPKYVGLNAEGQVTLVYIHGAFSSPAEFSLVIPHLSPQYHLCSVVVSGITLFSHFPLWKQAVLPYFFYTDAFLPSKLLSRDMQMALINKTIQPASPTYTERRVSARQEGGMILCRQVANALVHSLPKGGAD
jgi:hypothetical protein